MIKYLFIGNNNTTSWLMLTWLDRDSHRLWRCHGPWLWRRASVARLLLQDYNLLRIWMSRSILGYYFVLHIYSNHLIKLSVHVSNIQSHLFVFYRDNLTSQTETTTEARFGSFFTVTGGALLLLIFELDHNVWIYLTCTTPHTNIPLIFTNNKITSLSNNWSSH